MKFVDVVVQPRKTARHEGRVYTEGQTFSAPEKKARFLKALGRVEIDAAGNNATPAHLLAKAHPAETKQLIAEQRATSDLAPQVSEYAEEMVSIPRRKPFYVRRDMRATR